MNNVDKFSGKAEIYDRYRPEYPAAVYDFIADELGLPKDSVIADIGAGTGLFCMPLLERNYTVYCVEPNVEMKAVLDGKAKDYKNYRGIGAVAEHTGLPDRSVDCITVAQAFHWFQRDAFQEECRRILKPHGKVVLLWNVKDESWALTKQLSAVNQKYCPDFKGFSGGLCDVGCEQFNDFFSGTCRTQRFENNIYDDHYRTFVGRCLSSSYAPKEGEKDYEEYKEALKELFFRFADDMWTVIKNETVIYWGEI